MIGGTSPELKNPGAIDGLSDVERAVLGVMVTVSLHPVCRSLREALGGAGVGGGIGEIEEVPGSGVMVTDGGGGRWRLGRRSWALADGEGAACVFARGGVEVAAFQFGDAVRVAAKESINSLVKNGLGVHF